MQDSKKLWQNGLAAWQRVMQGLARRRAWMILMSEVRLSLLIDNFKIFDR
jgi:hypothetical protein